LALRSLHVRRRVIHVLVDSGIHSTQDNSLAKTLTQCNRSIRDKQHEESIGAEN
jgi:hypothetical protein